MLSSDSLKKLAIQWHTSEGAVHREYVQHVFLSYLYEDPASNAFLFKGGTALRILFQSPRFSGDLDFTVKGTPFQAKALVEKVMIKVRQEIHELTLVESKLTTGGYFGILRGQVGSFLVEVQVQVSSRKASARGELIVVATPLIPSYNVLALAEDLLVEEKIAALLTRAKPRDFYDLYFMLRKPLGRRILVASKRREILLKLKGMDSRRLYQELREFLPRSHWAIIQQLPDQLRKELERFG